MTHDDKFSHWICIECGMKVSTSYHFMDFCYENQRLLRSSHFNENLLVHAVDYPVESPIPADLTATTPSSVEQPDNSSPLQSISSPPPLIVASTKHASKSPPMTVSATVQSQSEQPQQVEENAEEEEEEDMDQPMALSTMVECQLNEEEEEGVPPPSDLVQGGDSLPPGNPYRCSVCFREFAKKANVLSHFQTQHTNLEVPSAWKYDIEPAKCPLCNELVECLFAHLEYHAGRRTFKCQSCEWAFYSKNYLTIHAAKLHKVDAALDAKPDKFTCKLCPPGQQQCRDYDDLVAHYRQWHLNEMKNKLEQCQICGRETRYMKVHLQKHHNDNSPFKCHLCEKSYAKDRYLQAHFSSTHRDQMQSMQQAPPPPMIISKGPPPVLAVNPLPMDYSMNGSGGGHLMHALPPPPLLIKAGQQKDPAKRPRTNLSPVRCVKCTMEFPNNRMLNMHIQRYHNSSSGNNGHPVTAEVSVTALPANILPPSFSQDGQGAKKPATKRRRASVAATGPPKDMWNNSALAGMLVNMFGAAHGYES